MNHLIKLLVVVFSLLFFMSAQAQVRFDMPVNKCAIFADEEVDDKKKEEGDKKEGSETTEEEEEPDCD